MDTTSLAYVLCRIEDDSSLTPVSEHEDLVAAVVAGKHQVEVEDFDFSYGVYADGARVICFAEGRLGPTDDLAILLRQKGKVTGSRAR
jgi:hypothetical protein